MQDAMEKATTRRRGRKANMEDGGGGGSDPSGTSLPESRRGSGLKFGISRSVSGNADEGIGGFEKGRVVSSAGLNRSHGVELLGEQTEIQTRNGRSRRSCHKSACHV